MLISKQVLEAHGSLREFSKNKGVAKCHLPPPFPSLPTATCRNQHSARIHYLIYLHQALPLQLGLPHSQHCRTPPLENELKLCQHWITQLCTSQGASVWWQWLVTSQRGLTYLVST